MTDKLIREKDSDLLTWRLHNLVNHLEAASRRLWATLGNSSVEVIPAGAWWADPAIDLGPVAIKEAEA